MGWYINGIGTTFSEKIENLKSKHAAKVVTEPSEFTEDLVCVVDNGAFAAAAWMKDNREFQAWKPKDGRNRVWMIVPGVENLAI